MLALELRFLAIGSIAVAMTFASSVARADGATARPDVAEGEASAAPRVDGAWLYTDSASIPTPMRTLAISRVTYVSSADGATRPFASDLARPGAMLEAGAEVGLTRTLSLQAIGATDAIGSVASPSSGMTAGLRFAPFAASSRSMRLVFSGGYLGEMSGHSGLWARVAAAEDLGRVRLAAAVHGEHVFSTTRDSIDVMVTAGASYAVAGPLRAGVEYIAQDLEGAIDPTEAEGMRHFAGPNVSFELLDKRLLIAAGPAFGLSYRSPPVVGRIGVTYAF